MKEGIHPKYVQSKVECACGHSFITRSTIPVIKLGICSHCHPFFTGKQKLVDTAGRVERFAKRFAKTSGKTVKKTPKKIKISKAKKSSGKILSTAPRKTAVQKKNK